MLWIHYYKRISLIFQHPVFHVPLTTSIIYSDLFRLMMSFFLVCGWSCCLCNICREAHKTWLLKLYSCHICFLVDFWLLTESFTIITSSHLSNIGVCTTFFALETNPLWVNIYSGGIEISFCKYPAIGYFSLRKASLQNHKL